MFEKELYDAIEATSAMISQVATKYRHLGRREYVEAINSAPDLPKNAAKIALKLYEPHKEAIDLLLDEVKASCRSAQTLERAREMLGGVTFIG